MKQFIERVSKLSAAKLAVLTVELKQQLEAQRCAPIAVVGVACRLPGGANDPDRYWKLLNDRTNGVIEVPPDRWDVDAYYDADPNAPGKMVTRWGGFLRDVNVRAFDAPFFGIATREAETLDPQQRLMLECTYEALEDAGIRPDSLGGTSTGVFVGISTNDYGTMLARLGPARIDPYRGTGNAFSAAAGRISYALGLEGPSMAVDTACSSTLVALHYACQSLRMGECTTAIVAGVNLMLSPENTIYFSRGGFMAPDGRCKAFDEAANGYVRGEGCGAIVLRTKDAARTSQQRIRALIVSSAVNQDGRSAGFTVPNGTAQEKVIRDALARAEVPPSSVQYVEAHGTGTSLGDPIEANALARAYGSDRPPGRPLLIGSVKTNIGHLEAAAGIAGVIKVVLALENKTIPGQLHLERPSSLIRWRDLPLAVASRSTPWPEPAEDAPRRAGLSAFAFQGTNVHVIIEEAPPAAAEIEAGVACPLLLSAKSERSLRLLAQEYVSFLVQTRDAFSDIVFTALHGRAHYPWRLAVMASSAPEAARKLRAFVDGAPTTDGLWWGEANAVAAGEVSPAVSSDDATVVSAAMVRHRVEPTSVPLAQRVRGRWVTLPTYAFVRDVHWFDDRPAASGSPSVPAPRTEPSIATGQSWSEAAALAALRRAATPAEQCAQIRELVRHRVADLLGDYRQIADDEPLVLVGLDSLMAELSNWAQSAFALDEKMSPAALAQRPTLRGLAEYLQQHMKEEAAPTPPQNAPDSGPVDEQSVLRTLAQASEADQRTILRDLLRGRIQDLLGDGRPIGDDEPLVLIGLDSLMAAELRSWAQTTFRLDEKIGPAVLAQHPSLRALADYLQQHMKAAPAVVAEPVAAVASPDLSGMDTRAALAKAPTADEQRAIIRDALRRRISDLLGDDRAIGDDEPLVLLGLDSLMAAELRSWAQTVFALEQKISPAILAQHPTLGALASYLQQHMKQGADEPSRI